MLKRQRPSSPSPISPEASLEDVSADLYQPDPKRRRYFGTSKSPEHRFRTRQNDADDSENEVDDGREEYFIGRREWQTEAGAYKDANVLLHDLHAEQRHRMLFSTSSRTFSPHFHDPPRNEPSPNMSQSDHNKSQPHVSHLEDPASQFYPQDDQSRHSETYSEAQRVSHCYEDTNRFLGSLFLSRRRELQYQPQTS